jgi:hypothetical protein
MAGVSTLPSQPYKRRDPACRPRMGTGGDRDVPARVLLMEASVMQLTDNHRRYWRKNLNITAILLVIWFVVTFVVSYYTRAN